jgi:lysozyme
MLQVSEVGLTLIKEFESCRLSSYLDQRGVLTIGYGHTGADVQVGLTCTAEEATQWLAHDVQTAVVGVIKSLDVVPTQNQFDALVCFTYNVGVGSEAHSTLIKQLNAGHVLLAGDEFLKWDHVNGVANLGLLRRRQAEQALFLKA